MTRRLRLLPVLVALVLGLGFAAGPAQADGGGDNTAIAVNTKDGTSLFKLAFSIKRVAGDVVDSTNAAVAFSSCSDCQTVAVAFEVVLVTGDPSTVTPTNLALAVNVDCTSCVTVAEAYQFVLSTGGEVHFTADGNRMLAEIRSDLIALSKEDLTVAELQARLDEIAKRIAYVLQTQLVPAGNSGAGGGGPPASGDTSTTTQPGETTPTTETQPAETTPTVTETTTTETSSTESDTATETTTATTQ